MRLYLDASAWVSLYTREPHTPTAQAVVARARGAGATLCVSSLALPEVVAALRGQRDAKRLRPRRFERALADLERDWGAVLELELTAALAHAAAALARAHPLSGADAAHLSTALALAGEPDDPLELITFDARLRAAAEALGLPLAAPDATA